MQVINYQIFINICLLYNTLLRLFFFSSKAMSKHTSKMPLMASKTYFPFLVFATNLATNKGKMDSLESTRFLYHTEQILLLLSQLDAHQAYNVNIG